jgi:tRNA A-37 threonylcarbamoyl transferase component Bud32
MRWCFPGHEQDLADLEALLAATPWPGPPPGFTALTPARRMRAVLRGTWPAPSGAVPIVVKWSRPDALADRVSLRLRGGKGPREGRTLRALARLDVPAPAALAYADDEVDLLVTAFLSELEPLPAPDDAAPELVRDVARLVAHGHDAGLRHRDAHAGNLGTIAGHATYVDLGGARVGRPLAEGERAVALAALRNALLGGSRRTQRMRALIAYEEAVGIGDPRADARAQAREIEELALRQRRRFLRGRDRRPTRPGRHFEVFAGREAAYAVRFVDATTPAWHVLADAWLLGEPADATALKAGGHVLHCTVPDSDEAVVLKRYGPVTPGRLPRPVRAFRRAFALSHRGIAVPPPRMAAARSDGAGVYVAGWVDAPDLHAFTAGGRGGALARLAPGERRLLCDRLGRFLRSIHDAEVTHRDLKAPNLLVRLAQGVPTFWVADLEGARIRRGPVPWARRARDLARLDASLDAAPRDRARVLRAYVDVLPRPPWTRKALARHVAVHVRRKRGPAGIPR